MEIKIDINIYESLKYFSKCRDNDPVNDFLSFINENGVIEIENNNFGFNVNSVELDKTGSKIVLYFLDRAGNKKVQEWKIGKFIVTLFKAKKPDRNLSDLELNHLVQCVVGATGFERFLEVNKLKLIEGKDFLKAYSTTNYVACGGSLGKSCMNDHLNVAMFYTLVSDVLSVLKIEDSSGKIWGRCLVWETSKGRYQDRCYIVNDMYLLGFYEYVFRKKGIKYNYHCNYEEDYEVIANKDSFIKNLKKLLDEMGISFDEFFNEMFEKSIYLDTMNIIKMDTSSGVISFKNSKLGSYEVEKDISVLLNIIKRFFNISGIDLIRIDTSRGSILHYINELINLKENVYDLDLLIDVHKFYFLTNYKDGKEENIYILLLDDGINLGISDYDIVYLAYWFRSNGSKWEKVDISKVTESDLDQISEYIKEVKKNEQYKHLLEAGNFKIINSTNVKCVVYFLPLFRFNEEKILNWYINDVFNSKLIENYKNKKEHYKYIRFGVVNDGLYFLIFKEGCYDKLNELLKKREGIKEDIEVMDNLVDLGRIISNYKSSDK